MHPTFNMWALGPRRTWLAMSWGLLALVCAVPGHAASGDDAASPSAPVSHAYRCKDAGGQVRYSQWPCPGGDKLGELADHRTAAQRRHAIDVQVRDEALLRRMGRQRHHQEKVAAEQGAGSLSPRPHPPAKASDASPSAHAPVPLQRCRPPKCFTSRTPKVKPAT